MLPFEIDSAWATVIVDWTIGIFLLLCLCFKCKKVVNAGQKILKEIQDSISETERSERLGARKKEKQRKEKDKEKEKTKREEEPRPDKTKVDDKNSLYPTKELGRLKFLSSETEPSSSSEKEDSEREKPTDESSEEDVRVRSERSKTAPPLSKEVECGYSFCLPRTRKRIQQMFPVFEEDGVRLHQPVEHKIIKELAESVRTYGVNANFTQAQLERLKASAMTPSDWSFVTKACLTMGQYLEWKAIWHDISQGQARANAAAGQAAWNFEMLTGQGHWVNNQINFPADVYGQINDCAIKAWKALTNKGEVSGNLTKITQGPTEPFSDFVARMVEAAGKIFGDSDTAMPLIEQLVYEQCTTECRQAITPWKGKGLQAWLKACREIGGPLTNAGLAAAILQSQRKGRGSNDSVTCYCCGKTGHMQKQCRGSVPCFGPSKVPGICPKCRKGKHWANECRSVKDLQGNPIGQSGSKNASRGPRPQGPQMYGAMQSTPSMKPRSLRAEPLQVRQDWTSVPPPDSY